MLRHAITLASITFLVSACAGAAQVGPHSAEQASIKMHKKALAKSTTKASAKPDEKDESKVATRKLGDFHVYEYAGTFSKDAVRLTEQVIAQEADVLVVDFVLEQGKTTSALRVRMKDDDVVGVSRITGDGETPATAADYDALMQKTQFVPDSNDELVGTEHTSCVVGEEQVDCDVTTYKVTFGHKHGTLSITTSAKFPGRDIGGNVMTEDGKVLYSAKLVEHGNEPPVVEAFAKADRFVPTEP